MLTRTRVEYTREMNPIRNQMEMLLQTAGINAQELAALADARVRASSEELEAALEGTVSLTQRLVLKQQLNRVRLLE